MNPAVKEGTIGLSNIAFRHVFGLNRFDIVLIQRENGDIWVKRVIGLPNETLSIKDNVLYIDHKPCPQTFLSDTVETEDFEEIFGRRAMRRRKLYNGMIKCNLFMYFNQHKKETSV